MGEWKDIESAPKDGTQIIGLTLLRDGSMSAVYLCGWVTAEYIAEHEGGDPEDYDAGWDSEGDEVFPRYWMPVPPLPSPPESKQ